MGQKTCFPQHELAHGLEIVQRGFVTKVPQSLPHLGKQQFGLIPETEQGFSASELFSGPGDLEDFVRSHRMRPGIARIAAENAITAVVATKIGERQKDFAGVGNDARLETLLSGKSGG